MFSKICVSAFSIFFLSLSAQADCGDEVTREFSGDEAVTMAYLLKNTNFAKKTNEGYVATWTLPDLQCVQTIRGVNPDVLPTFSCSKPAKVGLIAAKDFFDALAELGVMPEGGMSQVNIKAKNIICKVHRKGEGGYAVNPRCSVTARWGDECGYER
ncbi:hypothetical protein AZI85_13475 [Bdellovibrio bacteriovorus]|uniref:Lipoprotein n=1 Tax=Bdellovibrio bacteriovorus TaxID=959 RepID=A0A150WC09_BDEBC|nr:hypothetical protein [Bdellovibrio bacteriovorus]KYG60469.1 hypothetical protein AZI85_13475 [Bdellovibrio bacteriovorus]